MKQTHFEIDCLLVEDDPICRYITTKMLQPLTKKVDTCETAGAALTLLSKNQYHIAFLDLGLPDKDGTELAEDIREKLNLSLPIIAITGHLIQTDLNHFPDHGFAQVLTKPISIAQLSETIREFVPLA